MFERVLNYISTIGFADVLDILIVAVVIYEIIALVRKSNSKNLANGLMIYVLALWISAILKLTMVTFILKKGVELGLLALLILFQPEIRRTFERIGSRFSTTKKGEGSLIGRAITQTVLAADEMSKSKTGALIIFERKMRLSDVISTGTLINADVSDELLKNLFYNKAPLHDGAVIIRDGRILAAGCVLPLTNNKNLSKDLGMRHRAGLGMSEQSDSIVLIVSEETGAISLACEGMLKRHLKTTTLDKILRKELLVEDEMEKKKNNFFGFLESLLNKSSSTDN